MGGFKTPPLVADSVIKVNVIVHIVSTYSSSTFLVDRSSASYFVHRLSFPFPTPSSSGIHHDLVVTMPGSKALGPKFESPLDTHERVGPDAI